MGAETKLKQKVGRRPPPCAPRRVPARQGYPATTPPAPPSGHRNATPTPPRKRRSPRRNPLSTIKARAASHPIAGVPGAVAPGEIYFESPPSPEGKGVGGMGAEKQAKVKGQAGNQKGKPPVGYHSGKVGRRLPPPLRPPPGSGKARSAGDCPPCTPPAPPINPPDSPNTTINKPNKLYKNHKICHTPPQYDTLRQIRRNQFSTGCGKGCGNLAPTQIPLVRTACF